MDNRLLTVAQAAALVGVSRQAIDRASRNPRRYLPLAPDAPAGKRLFRARDVLSWASCKPTGGCAMRPPADELRALRHAHTVAQIAAMYHVSLVTVYRWLRKIA
jgi:hypothetical protein